MTPRDSALPRDCARFRAQMEDLLGSQSPEGLERHRASCAPCSAAFERRRLVVGLLEEMRDARAFADVPVPAELERLAAGAGEPGELVRVMLKRLDPIPAPAELDRRVLGPPIGVRPGRRLVVISSRRLILRAAAAVLVAGAGLALYAKLGTNGSRPRIELVRGNVADLPPALLQQAALLGGSLPSVRKG